MNWVTLTDRHPTARQAVFSCLLSAGVYSHYLLDSAPSSGQQHNKRNHFPFSNMILSMGSWEMEKKIHITLAGQRDLSYTSTELPYLDFSVTKAFSICGKSWKNSYWYFLFSSLVSTWGERGTGAEREDHLSALLYPFTSPPQHCAVPLSFVQKNIAELKKEMERDSVFRKSRLAKMGSDVTLAIASKGRAQQGQRFLSCSKWSPKGLSPKQILQILAT